MDIGQNIKACREAAGMTQRQLAEAVNTDQTSIARYETGGRTPSVEMLRRLSSALGVSAATLME